MRLVRNTGNDRVIDLVRPLLKPGQDMGVVSAALSMFAFAELVSGLQVIERCRLVLPPEGSDLQLLGTAADRPARNRLQARWLAGQLAQWLTNKVVLRRATAAVPQALAIPLGSGISSPGQGFCSLISSSNTARASLSWSRLREVSARRNRH